MEGISRFSPRHRAPLALLGAAAALCAPALASGQSNAPAAAPASQGAAQPPSAYPQLEAPLAAPGRSAWLPPTPGLTPLPQSTPVTHPWRSGEMAMFGIGLALLPPAPALALTAVFLGTPIGPLFCYSPPCAASPVPPSQQTAAIALGLTAAGAFLLGLPLLIAGLPPRRAAATPQNTALRRALTPTLELLPGGAALGVALRL